MIRVLRPVGVFTRLPVPHSPNQASIRKFQIAQLPQCQSTREAVIAASLSTPLTYLLTTLACPYITARIVRYVFCCKPPFVIADKSLQKLFGTTFGLTTKVPISSFSYTSNSKKPTIHEADNGSGTNCTESSVRRVEVVSWRLVSRQ